ncbi:hypothetical protein JCM19376_30020 [Fusibacter bizertensis]
MISLASRLFEDIAKLDMFSDDSTSNITKRIKEYFLIFITEFLSILNFLTSV